MFKQVTKEELQVPANVDYLGQLRDFVIKIGHKYNFSERVINAFKLSIDEAATNIIRHAYRDQKGNITIRAIVKKNSLTIVLVDQGKFFDPRNVKDPDLKRYVEIGKKGGLGIFMMRKLIDEIDYRKTEDGNELRLTKMRDGSPLRKSLIPSIPITLRVKYSFYACLVFSLVVAIIYFIYFYQWSNRISQRWHTVGIDRAKYLSSNVTPNLSGIIGSESGTFFEAQIAAGSAIKSLIDTDDRNIIYQVFVLDSTGVILHAQRGKEILETAVKYEIPRQSKLIAPGIRQFKVGNREVYDYSEPIYDEEMQRRIGASHVWIDNAAPRAEIRHNRFANLQVALLIWAIGNAGIFFFTTIVLNPFRHLTDWIRDLGHTEVQDEMDIDDSSEVGEIAKAFSDMTQQLRVSQANLAEQERFQKEMQVAQEIQQALLPSEFPQVEGYELSSYYVAAKQVGGDYYDFVEVDKDTLGIVVADVSGKGVPGSLVMTMIRTALRTEARGIKDAAEVLARVNHMVVNDMKKGMFVTVFYMILDSKHRKISYASAGHNPMILYRAGRNKTYYLNPKGFPIGISLPDKDQFRNTIESDTIQLAEDDIIIIYTDGVTEAMNSKRYLFGEERFLNVIRNYGNLGAEAFVNMLKDEVKSFTEDYPQNDDITLVAIKEKFSSEKMQLQRAQKAFRLITENNVPVKEACAQADISVYMLNKYKQQFEEEGVDSVVVEEIEVESKHLSIEEKTKIYDIILKHPEYGAKRISEELKTEVYGFEEIKEKKIYDELVRSRLNTRELREAFVQRGGKKRRRIKQPGTPLLTMDGKVIMQKGGYEEEPLPPSEVKPPVKQFRPKYEEKSVPAAGESQIPVDPQKESERQPEKKKPYKKPVAPASIRDFSGLVLGQPIEDILDKNSDRRKKAPADAAASPDTKAPKLEPSTTSPESEARENIPDALIEHDVEEHLLAAEATDETFYQETAAELDLDFELSYSDDGGLDSLLSVESEFLDSDPEKIYTEPEIPIESEPGPAPIETVKPMDLDLVIRSESEIVPETVPEPPSIAEDDLISEAIVDLEAETRDLFKPGVESGITDSVAAPPVQGPSDQPTEDDLVSELIADIQRRSTHEDYYESGELSEQTKLDNEPATEPAPSEAESAFNRPEVRVEKEPVESIPEDTDLLETLLDEVVRFDSFRSQTGLLQESPPAQVPGSSEQELPIENEFFEGIQWLEESTESDHQSDDGKFQDTGSESSSGTNASTEQSDNDLFLFDEDLSLVKELTFPPNKEQYASDLDELELMELIRQNAGMDDPLLSSKNDRSSRKKTLDFEQIHDYADEEYESLDIDENSLYDYDELENVDPIKSKTKEPIVDEVNFDRIQQMLSDAEKTRIVNEPTDTGTDILRWRIVETRPNLKPENQSEKDVRIDLSSILAEGLRHYEQGNFNAAISKFGQIIQSQPDSIDARTMLGHCYFHKKMYRHAEHEYNQITRLDPSDLEARNNLAVVYAIQEKYEKAIQVWESILNCDPERISVHKNIEKAQRMMI